MNSLFVCLCGRNHSRTNSSLSLHITIAKVNGVVLCKTLISLNICVIMSL